MAGFSTHVTVSTTLGVAYGAVGYTQGMPLVTCAVGAGLCGVAGMLPDLDGDTGVPVRETLALAAAVVPALLVETFQGWGLSGESMALALVAVYLLMRFGVGGIFKRTTRHRGMWHSIPAALNVGLLVFLICSPQALEVRCFKAGAAVLGFLSHLLLDEIWCVDVLRFRFKRSCGTAMKLWSARPWPNLLTYAQLFILTVVAYHQSRMEWPGAEGTRVVDQPEAMVEEAGFATKSEEE